MAPVFIVGLPRTGSTHLHALMALIEGARTPRFWEMSQPSPPPRTETYLSDPRIGEIQRVVDGLGVDFQRLHVLSATRTRAVQRADGLELREPGVDGNVGGDQLQGVAV